MTIITRSTKRAFEGETLSAESSSHVRQKKNCSSVLGHLFPKLSTTQNLPITQNVSPIVEGEAKLSVYKIIQRKFTGLFYRKQEPSTEHTAPCEVLGKDKKSEDTLGIISSIRARLPERPFKYLSAFYEVGSVELLKGGIAFINGINTSEDEAKEHALRLSSYAKGVKVHGIYNATHTAPIDLLECLVGQCRVQTSPVQLLKDKWNQFIATQSPDAKFLQICHSGGAIHVLNALRSSLQEVRDRIIVIAISPAKIVPNELCYQAYNYASKRDFVPSLDLAGRYWYASQLTKLEPHEGASFIDHYLNSDTFQEVTKGHIITYLAQHGKYSNEILASKEFYIVQEELVMIDVSLIDA